MSAIALLTLFLLPLVGFALLAATQDQHRRAMTLAPAAARTCQLGRASAGTLILLSLPLAIWHEGPGLGTLLWGTLLSAAACTITVTLSWRPRWLVPVARLLN